VLIIDFDVHHGNGTQDLFYHRGDVAYFSIHRDAFYPGTGAAAETGSGHGLGMNRNVPIVMGTPRADQMRTFKASLQEFANQVRPDLILASAGFDAHVDDPVGSLGWITDDYTTVAEMLRAIAEAHCGGKIASLLEGGYHPTALSDCVTAYLEIMLSA